MNAQPIIFTDLDGTLLDRNSYSFEPAVPALQELCRRGIPIILNSSKTFAEMIHLRLKLGNSHPFVIENGAAVIIPDGYFVDTSRLEKVTSEISGGISGYRLVRFGQSYQDILDVLALARSEGFMFNGFNDWSAAEIAQITGLSVEAAQLSKQRCGSEPVILDGDRATHQAFARFLHQHRLKVLQGGRFSHVMGLYDKAMGLQWLMSEYRKHFSQLPVLSVALGDSYNDEAMLNCADIPVVVRSPHSDALDLSNDAAIYTTLPGPEGWREAIEQILTH